MNKTSDHYRNEEFESRYAALKQLGEAHLEKGKKLVIVILPLGITGSGKSYSFGFNLKNIVKKLGWEYTMIRFKNISKEL